MSVAQTLTQRMKEKGVGRSRKSVYAIAMDNHNVHCMTEDMLDAWWASLAPERKAELYEADLEGLLDETVALANPFISEFQTHVDQFFADMQKLQKSPFTGLATKEAMHGTAV